MTNMRHLHHLMCLGQSIAMSIRETSVRGILFDKDGTLLDYHASWMPLNWEAATSVADGDSGLARTLMKLGGWNEDTDRIAAGSPMAQDTNRDIAELWHRHMPGSDVEAVYRRINDVFNRGAEETAVPVADLGDLLGGLKSRGIALGIATSDNAHAAHATVRRFELDGLFDFVSGYDSGWGAKPDPSVVQGFCETAGLESATVMMVGDNSHDIETGRNARVGWTVGVLTGTSGRDELAPIADYVLDDISALPALIDTLGA